MAKSDVLVRMKADTSGYNANIAKARRQLDQFKQDNLTLGGVISQSTKSIVAAAAQYASFAAIIGTVTSGMAEAISQGTAMAREMEGVKMAFDRLNQPGLLDNLREATHGTVNDLELMKNAVKFENFGLSLDQMGTFLAFAQQQAKDTGQSVEYLVDSIVTGLGRKSLPILDNLGLSATEIKERMKETGDMTTAVADIIKDRMEKAGGYVETASDRAAQAQVRLDNAMMELGNTFQTLTGEASNMWTEIKIGAIDLLNTAIKPLIAALNAIAAHANVPSAEDILTRGMTDVTDTVDDNGRLIRKNAISSIPEISVTGTNKKKSNKGSGGSGFNTNKIAFNPRNDKVIKPSDYIEVPSVWQEYAKGIKESMAEIDHSLDNLSLDNWSSEARLAEEAEKANRALQQQKMAFNMSAQAASNFGSALASIEDPAAKAAGTVIQAIANIALGFSAAAAQASSMGPYGWIAYVAAGLATMATAISTVHSLTGYAEGGEIKGNYYSGDQMPIMANAGELVLTKAMQGNLASQLSDQNRGIHIVGVVQGENIVLAARTYGQRWGKNFLIKQG